MFSNVFLAMTAGEMQESAADRVAYMALHFSPYGTGLSNPPQRLPENSILLLDDSMPITNHDPVLVVRQLQELVHRFSISALLLDFQRNASDAGKAMTEHILQVLNCPVAVTQAYAKELGCPVFLPPPPVNKPPEAYLTPWLKQGVYLEIAPETIQFTVTEKGSVSTTVSPTLYTPLSDDRLRCHYNVEVFSGRAVFTLTRTKEDLALLTEDAYRLGVRGVVGLHQELGK